MADKKLTLGKIAFTITSLGIAFWVGRLSSPEVTVNQDEATASSSSHSRAPRSASPYRESAGAGEQALTTTLQLRKIYDNEGTTAAVSTLAKMNSGELSALARDLNTQSAESSNYAFYSEISATFSRWAEIDPTEALEFALASKLNSFKRPAIYAIFTSLAKTDPELAREKLAAIADPGQRWALKRNLCQALAKSDPQAWLQEIQSDPTLARRMNISSIAQGWAIEDPANAAALLQRSPEHLQLQGIKPIAKIWAAKDPKAALAWAQSLSKVSHRNNALSSVLAGIAVHDPDAALANLETLPESLRGKGVLAIFKTLSHLDFDTALSKASTLTSPAAQRLAFKAIITQNGYSSSKHTAEQLHQLAKSVPNAGLRNQVLEKLGDTLANYSKLDAENLLRTYSSKDQLKIQLRMMNQMTYNNPLQALEIYRSLPPEKVESYTLSNIIRYLSKNDPDTALEFVLKEKPSASQTRAIQTAFSKIAENDPDDAIQRLDKLPEGSLRAKALKSIAETWSKTDPDAAMLWAATLPDGEKNKAVLAILPQMAESSPEDAASHVKAMLQSTPEKSQANISNSIYYIMDTWSKTDPASAGAWAIELEEGSTKTNAMSQLAKKWYQEDSDGVADWIDALPEGKNRDSSIRAIASNLRQKDPATAFAWAESIGNDKNRINELSSIIRTWKSNDPEKARRYVENKADLSADELTRLMKHFEKPKD